MQHGMPVFPVLACFLLISCLCLVENDILALCFQHLFYSSHGLPAWAKQFSLSQWARRRQLACSLVLQWSERCLVSAVLPFCSSVLHASTYHLACL